MSAPNFKQSIVSHYLAMDTQYSRLYSKCIVLECIDGKFYIIGSSSDDSDKNILNTIHKLLDITITKFVDNFSCMCMTQYKFDKVLPKLLNHGYTIVKRKEDFDGKTLSLVRKVDCIMSLGNYLDDFDLSSENSQYNVSIFCETKKIRDIVVLESVGMASVNMMSGQVTVAEYKSSRNDPEAASHAVSRWLERFNPLDLLIVGDSAKECTCIPTGSRSTASQIFVNWKSRKAIGNIECPGLIYRDRDLENPNNHEQILQNEYGRRKHLAEVTNSADPCHYERPQCVSAREYANIYDKPLAANALLYLMSHMKSREKYIWDRMEWPICEDSSSIMYLEKGAEQVLHLHELIKFFPLQTSMGRRLMESRIYMPSTSHAEIQRRHNLVRLCNTKQFLKIQTVDFEMFMRRMVIGKFTYNHVSTFRKALNDVISLYNSFCDSPELQQAFPVANAASRMLETLDQDIVNDDPSQINIFVKSRPMLHNAQENYRHFEDIFKHFSQSFRNYFKNSSDDDFKVVLGKSNHLTCTLGSGMFHHPLSSPYPCVFGYRSKRKGPYDYEWNKHTATISHNQKHTKSEIIWKHNKLSDDTSEAFQRLKTQMHDEFQQHYMTHFYHRFHQDLKLIVQSISELDISVACAHLWTTRKMKFVLPTVEPYTDERGSFIEAIDMFHPLVPYHNNTIAYTPNSLSLTEDKPIVVINGANGGGKSTLARNLVISAIMCQAGLVVPAGAMTMSPFTRIFTRFAGTDDMLRGTSSFTNDMMSIRSVLDRADNRTLVLADEVAGGTTPLSSLCTLAGIIKVWQDLGTKVICGTHIQGLHEICGPKVAHKHFSIQLCNNEIVYDHLLKDGPLIDDCYGLDIANRLFMRHRSFVAESRRVQQIICGEYATLFRKNKYNRRKLENEYCKMCYGIGEDIHHIRPQSQADPETGMVDGIHIHSPNNLIKLCKPCHLKIHKEQGTEINNDCCNRIVGEHSNGLLKRKPAEDWSRNVRPRVRG